MLKKKNNEFKCVFFNGDSCDYEDYCDGKTEDGYCKCEFKTATYAMKHCDSYTEE
jgi:hypothetical protein